MNLTSGQRFQPFFDFDSGTCTPPPAFHTPLWHSPSKDEIHWVLAAQKIQRDLAEMVHKWINAN
jgi:hypothetical protein